MAARNPLDLQSVHVRMPGKGSAGKRPAKMGVISGMARHAASLVLLMALASCSTFQDSRNQALGGPTDHVMVFGSFRIDNLLLDQPIDRILMVRVDPALPKTQMEPSVAGNMFFSDPLPTGSRWRIASVTVGEEELAVSFDFRADQPGLLFLGSMEISGDGSQQSQVRRFPTPSERRLLQDLLDAWKGTAWEPAIRARIRRIEDHFSQESFPL